MHLLDNSAALLEKRRDSDSVSIEVRQEQHHRLEEKGIVRHRGF